MKACRFYGLCPLLVPSSMILTTLISQYTMYDNIYNPQQLRLLKIIVAKLFLNEQEIVQMDECIDYIHEFIVYGEINVVNFHTFEQVFIYLDK